jgi:cell wall-associated NlpC family hydrolase
MMKKLLPLFSVCVLTVLAGCATVKSGEFPAYVHVPVAAGNTPAANPHNPPAANQLSAERLLLTREAATYLRAPYASPSNTPRTFDCSSYVSYVYAQFGYTIPLGTASFNNVGTRIDWKDALPGDILVFAREKGSSTIDHVAILWEKSAGGGLAGSRIIHAASVNTGRSLQRGNPDTGTGVVITELGLRGDGIVENEYFYQRFMFCTRVLEQ